ncbi:MAG TPA: TonB-dependent receptor, partial [Bryobacteraceae bacterium]
MSIRLWIGLYIFCASAAAQVTSGTILGTVTDSSGGSVSGAKVRITNTGTNISSDIKTNPDGNFELPYLIAGVYDVVVEAQGFKSFRQTDIKLETAQKYRVDVKLEVGNSTQTVTVAANSEVLQTDSSELSQTVDRRTIESLPNINDNPLLYAMTMAGVVTTGAFLDPNNVNTGDNSRQYFSGFTVNGSRPISSNIQLDGAFNTNGYVNEIAVIPARDAIGEVKVITNAYSAEYGRAGGGVINFTTKSGDNVFHGSLFENLRNSDLNANSFGNNTFGTDANGNPNRPRPPFSTNAFGGTLGGPVWIPKVYDGHNKTFFFFSYSGLRRSQGTSTYYTVPTALERVGDFSQTLAQVNVGGKLQTINRQIYLPFPDTTTVTTVAPGQYQVTRQQASAGGVLNKIPGQYLDPVALKLMSYYPLPNITPLNPDGTNNYFTNAPTYTRS